MVYRWYIYNYTGWWYTYPYETYEFVSSDCDIPNKWKFIKFMVQTTNQILYMFMDITNLSYITIDLYYHILP